jgi:hypothetical protein
MALPGHPTRDPRPGPAGLTALEAIVRDLTTRQARKAAILDNVRKDMHWLAWGESAEGLLADDPDLTIPGAADLLAKDHSWLVKLLKLLKLLDSPVRRAIMEIFHNSDGYIFREVFAYALEALATGGPGDQDLIGRAVSVGNPLGGLFGGQPAPSKLGERSGVQAGGRSKFQPIKPFPAFRGYGGPGLFSNHQAVAATALFVATATNSPFP